MKIRLAVIGVATFLLANSALAQTIGHDNLNRGGGYRAYTKICIENYCDWFAPELNSGNQAIRDIGAFSSLFAGRYVATEIRNLSQQMITATNSQTQTITALTKTLEETYNQRLNTMEQMLILRLDNIASNLTLSEDEKARLKEEILESVRLTFNPDQ